MLDWKQKGDRVFIAICEFGSVKIYNVGNGKWHINFSWKDNNSGLYRPTLEKAKQLVQEEIDKIRS